MVDPEPVIVIAVPGKLFGFRVSASPRVYNAGLKEGIEFFCAVKGCSLFVLIVESRIYIANNKKGCIN